MRIERLLGIYLLLALCYVRPVAAAEPSLADAMEARDIETFQALFDKHSDANQAQADGMTALHWAIHHNALDQAQRLIASGAHVQATNLYGVTPLALACQSGEEKLVSLLLENGADANSSLPGGETAIMTAARTGRLAPVKLLIEKGADVNATEQKGQTALMWAAAQGHLEVVDALIDAGADVHVKLRSGFSALLFAVRQGKTDVALRLLQAGCDVNEVFQTQQSVRFGNGRLRLTPLILAVENGHFELAATLLKAGADPNAAPSGHTALHVITWVRKPIRGDGDPSPRGSGKYNSLDMVRLLSEAQADLDARLENGKSELGRFSYSGSTPFLLAAQASDLPLMKLLIELGADVTIPNVDGTTPLLAATGVGALGDGDESAGTEEETLATVEYLLRLGADINAVDQNGETVMHGAAYQSLAVLTKALYDHGADVKVWNRSNRAGWTPLQIAIGYRPGNFRPSPETIIALQSVMTDAGVSIDDGSELGSHERSWSASKNADQPWIVKDIEYATVGETQLRLDLHFPLHASNSPLVVWIHGGAWRSGSKSEMPLGELVKSGYTVASVDYRLSPVAQFPAQVHDIKAAIRYLRHLSKRYGYRSDRIAIAGSSAGGHLAALVGVTNEHKQLEGTIGDCLDESSRVDAIVDLYGPTNFATILQQSTPHGLDVRVPALQLLLGAQPEDRPELAKLASPVSHIDSQDPPLLLVHGDQDPQVPINQSHELHGRYREFNLPVEFEVIYGGQHGGDAFFDEKRMQLIKSFLDKHLHRNSDE